MTAGFKGFAGARRVLPGDEQGTQAKVTVWRRSTFGTMVRTLSEGDRVRISLGKPGEYNGQKTVAVTSETAMIALDG